VAAENEKPDDVFGSVEKGGGDDEEGHCDSGYGERPQASLSREVALGKRRQREEDSVAGDYPPNPPMS
jgi:hypothetical protein